MTSDDSRRSEIRSIYINEMKNSRHDQLASALLKLPTDDAQQIVRDLMSLRLAGWLVP